MFTVIITLLFDAFPLQTVFPFGGKNRVYDLQ